MMRAIRRGAPSSDGRPREHPRSGSRRNRQSTAFARRSLRLSHTSHRPSRRFTTAAVDPMPTEPVSTPSRAERLPAVPQITMPRTFDPLALVRRVPASVRSFGHVKTARSLAVFSRFERFWLELRGAIVVIAVDDEAHADAVQFPSREVGDEVITAVFSVENCLVVRSRSPKSNVLRLSKIGHAQHIWLRFEDQGECDIWEKALTYAASQRVVGISDFEFISPIGKGASGKVFLVADRKTGEKLALKVIDKTKVFESRSGFRHALDERLALEMVDGHPFFSRLRYAFQTRAFFYLAIDFYDGGDLYQYLRTHHGRLREAQVRSVAAEVSLALEHLHRLGFVYRDLKPENVLLDSKGHVRLADLGLCKLLPDKALTNTICGTHTYAAPEMLAVRNYGLSIDLWAFGVFVYHILRGRTPYEARDLDQVIANMNNRRIRFSSSTSPELVSMIKKLLDWNPETRLGCGAAGMIEVRGHSFFKGIDWRKVYFRDTEDDGLFSLPNKSVVAELSESMQPATVVVPPTPAGVSSDPSCVADHVANANGENPSTVVLIENDPGSANRTVLRNADGVVETVIPLNAKASTVSTQDACMSWSSPGATSDEVESPVKSIPKSKPLSRPKSSSSLGATRTTPCSKVGNKSMGKVDDQSQSISLREKMVAAAEQDDLRNFDMTEWGKISVDNDHDDANYGDCSLWPISRARRRLIEDERMIAGFNYCSASSPLALPDNL